MFLVFVALVVFALDRVTKFGVQALVPLGDSRLVFGPLFISHRQNTGAAFSLGLSHGNLFLIAAALASVGIVYAYRRVPATEPWTRVALGMILGGALGNAFDRLTSRAVTDFIDVRVWPVFNVADACIVIGALLLVWRLRGERAEQGAQPESGSR